MPLLRRGPLAGHYGPDYDGGSIVNLMATLIEARGGRTPHAELACLPAAEVARFDNVAYVVIDGLGLAQLERLRERGKGRAFLGRHPYRPISTVFPATTAAAVTSLITGASPAEHGILSWFLQLHDLGVVGAVLLAQTRTGTPLVGESFDLGRYLQLPRHLGTTRGRRAMATISGIVGSRFARAAATWTESCSCTTLGGLSRQLVSWARRAGGGLCYAYWPRYDSLCHVRGVCDRQAVAHLEEIDEMLGRTVERLSGTDTLLLVLADHGLVDIPRRAVVDLRRVDGLYQQLATVPSGDARAAFCFVRPARVRRFRQIVRRELSQAVSCVPGERLLAAGVFGPGSQHRSLEQRLGDYVLLARPGWALTSSLPGGPPPPRFVGFHGGMSADEMLVPLFAVPC